MGSVTHLLASTRPPFLILTLACVLLGLGTAVWSSGRVNAGDFLLVLAGALAAHISVNAFNEYSDFRSGLDSRTTRTPFSGGSGTLPAHPALARATLTTALVALALAVLIGVYFLWTRGLSLLPLGVVGLLIVVAYTPWLTRRPLLCLIAPGLGFGTLMVMGTHVALTGEYSWTAFAASLAPFFMVSDLLLSNQFPDVEADRTVGRKHYPILIGRRASAVIFGAFLLAAYLTIVVGVTLRGLPPTCLLGMTTLLIAVPTFVGVYRRADEVGELTPFLVLNVIMCTATPALVAAGLFIG